ncbi:uncharacterized protein LOC118348290 [Juglans regia]|uniref:Uncharacterized protein LOC118348290 n=1 Tax=Juglans regia TaxID=51240 RepID=A0A6P9EBC4_JUGRE|nr:uncharacterized protein LOC118348290 [Juglans regia]
MIYGPQLSGSEKHLKDFSRQGRPTAIVGLQGLCGLYEYSAHPHPSMRTYSLSPYDFEIFFVILPGPQLSRGGTHTEIIEHHVRDLATVGYPVKSVKQQCFSGFHHACY